MVSKNKASQVARREIDEKRNKSQLKLIYKISYLIFVYLLKNISIN